MRAKAIHCLKSSQDIPQILTTVAKISSSGIALYVANASMNTPSRRVLDNPPSSNFLNFWLINRRCTPLRSCRVESAAAAFRYGQDSGLVLGRPRIIPHFVQICWPMIPRLRLRSVPATISTASYGCQPASLSSGSLDGSCLHMRNPDIKREPYSWQDLS